MGINRERLRGLLSGMQKADPDADARKRVILGATGDHEPRTDAVALMVRYLLEDPEAVVPGQLPGWLADVSETTDERPDGAVDPRLTDLAERAVDELLGEDVTATHLVEWLEQQLGGESTDGEAPPVDDGPPRAHADHLPQVDGGAARADVGAG